jgi:hypothetical protein
MRKPPKVLAPVLALAVTAAVACGGGGGDDATADTTSTTVEGEYSTSHGGQSAEAGSTSPGTQSAEEGEEAQVLEDLSLQPLPGIFDPETVPQAPTRAYPGEVTGGSTVSTVVMPTGYNCTTDGVLQIPDIRVYPPGGGQDVVTWGLAVERLDASNNWQLWSTVRLDTRFAGPNGQQMDTWKAYPPATNVPVTEGAFDIQISTGSPGTYRVVSAVSTTSSGNIQAGFLPVGGESCTTP